VLKKPKLSDEICSLLVVIRAALKFQANHLLLLLTVCRSKIEILLKFHTQWAAIFKHVDTIRVIKVGVIPINKILMFIKNNTVASLHICLAFKEWLLMTQLIATMLSDFIIKWKFANHPACTKVNCLALSRNHQPNFLEFNIYLHDLYGKMKIMPCNKVGVAFSRICQI
jgi:hypothetical protein